MSAESTPRPTGTACVRATPQAPSLVSRAPYEQAYRSVAHTIAAVPEESLMAINLDVVRAVITVRGALPGIRALRPELEAAFRTFDPAVFDQLETHALALFHVNARYRMATAPVEPITALVERATALRDLFVADMTPLARRGLLSTSALDGRPRGQGFRNLVQELYVLVAELRASWERVRGRTGVQLAELEEAELLVDRIAIALGRREKGPSPSATAIALERQRAFTLFMKSYEALRRHVLYLRPAADEADAIAPSLYAGRGGRRRPAPRIEQQPAERTDPSEQAERQEQPEDPEHPEHPEALVPGYDDSARPRAFAAAIAAPASPTSSPGSAARPAPAFPALARLAAEDPFLPH